MFYLSNPKASDEMICKHAECIFGGIAPTNISDIDYCIRNKAIDKALVPIQYNDTISITSNKGTNVYKVSKTGILIPFKQLVNKPIKVLEEIDSL